MTTERSGYWSSGATPVIPSDRLGEIIAAASDVSIVISDIGSILGITTSPAAGGLGDLSRWEGLDIRDVLTIESVPKLEAELDRLARGEGTLRPVELNHDDGSAWEFPVRYTFHPIGADGAILMFGRDLRAVADTQRQLVRTQMALEREYEAQRNHDVRLRVLMESSAEAVVYVSLRTGRILDANPAAADLTGFGSAPMADTPFDALFAGQEEGVQRLSRLDGAEGRGRFELTLAATGARVGVQATVFRAAGDRIALCRLIPDEGRAAQSDDMATRLAGLFAHGVEGIVFTDRQGTILSANDAFLGLVNSVHATRVKDRPIADFLARGSIDSRVLIENATRTGHMRFYATRLTSEFGGHVNVEISATWLDDPSDPALVFVIRDTGRAEAQRPGLPVGDESMRSVMELVGSTTLKEIVAETTEVIEKMCIETAVELTRNNRVAAAEMLGLSRQSLYVKLRKYGLIARNGEG